MAVKVYHDVNQSLDLSFTVLKGKGVGGDDRMCPECKGWVRVSDTNYQGNPLVMFAIIHKRPCYNYRQFLLSQGITNFDAQN
jgi:hypothetical protein